MVGVNLRKIVLKKELSLVQDFIDIIDPNASIQSAEGHLILKSNFSNPTTHRYPIKLDGRIIGWVNGNEKAEVIAKLLAQLAYRELEKITLAQELLSKYKEITLLFNLSEKIIDSPDVQEVASLVLEEAQQLLKSRNGILLLRQENTNLLERLASFGPDCLLGQQATSFGKSVIDAIVETGRGEIVNDVLLEPCRGPSQSGVTSLICVPLKSKEATIGAIVLNRPHTRPYTAEDLKLLTTLACQSAGILNALLHERQLKESRQNHLIFRLSSQIRKSLELDAILETAVSEIYTALHLDRCCFLWCQAPEKPYRSVNQASQMLGHLQTTGGLEIVTESKRSNLPSIIGSYPPAKAGMLARKFHQRDLVCINNVQSIADSTTRQFLQAKQFVAFLAIPIQTRSGQMGVICCGTSRHSRIWSESEISLLQAVTNQLAIALDQSELYAHSRQAAQLAQDKAQQLETTLETLKKTQFQLVQSEKMSSIGQMVAGVAHEINNPVNFIHGNLKHIANYAEGLSQLVGLYHQEYPEPSDILQDTIDDIDLEFILTDLPKTLESMAVGTERIREIVLSLRNFSRLDQAVFKQVDIHEGIDSTLLLLHHRLKRREMFPGIKVVKNYSTLPLIECYPGQLNQVFMNILSNAIDALEDEISQRPKSEATSLDSASNTLASPCITIHTQLLDSNRIQIRISDNGPGIHPGVQARVFDPFFTTKDIGKGTGLGLSISYQIIAQRHNGNLSCQSDIGQGTEFSIEIPVYQDEGNSVDLSAAKIIK